MPISWNEIRSRALAFSKEWEGAIDENSDAKSFWDGLFMVFNVPRRRVATFESRVKKGDGSQGFIDLLWKKVVLVEHKSKGKDLMRAHAQAKDYFPGLKDNELPRYIVVCDFERFRVFDLETDKTVEFTLKQLPDKVQALGFIAGYESRVFKEQDPVNKKAALKIALLHDELEASGYQGHELEVLLVRLLFCFFADDSGIFLPIDIFEEYIRIKTDDDGSDLGPKLQELFQVLKRPVEKRLRNIDEHLSQFPYVNGGLFEEELQIATFTPKLRKVLLECCEVKWSEISPAIFGSLFQSIMDKGVRDVLGAHYTSESNILKAIGPLFLEELRAELASVKTQRGKLEAFHSKLSTLRFFDPACGCGNFLVIAYREIRLLELDVIRALHSKTTQLSLDAIRDYVKVDVDQFYGIEIEEWPAQIARVAMWLIDHQMNVLVSKDFGGALVRVPLVKSANIHHADALTTDWTDVCPSEECSYLLGNPPFKGARKMSKEQKAGAAVALAGVPKAKDLDLVASWYVKAARYLSPTAKAALVSTNSITQGSQVGILWSYLLQSGTRIHFAHRTFKWTNEAGKIAAVHCVIIGFANFEPTKRRLFDYATPASTPVESQVPNISPYLIDFDNTLLSDRRKPLCAEVSPMVFGSMANDEGNLLLSPSERDGLLAEDVTAAPYIREFYQVDQFLYGSKRYCLWLKGAPPSALRIPPIRKRVAACKLAREGSDRGETRALAMSPSLFGEIRQPTGPYLLVPRHTGESRKYIPMGFMGPKQICGDANMMVPNATLYEFGVLSSHMHMAWVNTVCGRLESRYRYSASIVYNNFPWPMEVSEDKKLKIEKAAQAVLDARASMPEWSLNDLYAPLGMPPALQAAHRQLDKAVDAAYGYVRREDSTDAKRVVFLFKLYEAMVNTLNLKAGAAKKAPRKGHIKT